jgi:hypothetical protein
LDVADVGRECGESRRSGISDVDELVLVGGITSIRDSPSTSDDLRASRSQSRVGERGGNAAVVAVGVTNGSTSDTGSSGRRTVDKSGGREVGEERRNVGEDQSLVGNVGVTANVRSGEGSDDSGDTVEDSGVEGVSDSGSQLTVDNDGSSVNSQVGVLSVTRVGLSAGNAGEERLLRVADGDGLNVGDGITANISNSKVTEDGGQTSGGSGGIDIGDDN